MILSIFHVPLENLPIFLTPGYHFYPSDVSPFKVTFWTWNALKNVWKRSVNFRVRQSKNQPSWGEIDGFVIIFCALIRIFGWIWIQIWMNPLFTHKFTGFEWIRDCLILHIAIFYYHYHYMSSTPRAYKFYVSHVSQMI